MADPRATRGLSSCEAGQASSASEAGRASGAREACQTSRCVHASPGLTSDVRPVAPHAVREAGVALRTVATPAKTSFSPSFISNRQQNPVDNGPGAERPLPKLEKECLEAIGLKKSRRIGENQKNNNWISWVLGKKRRRIGEKEKYIEKRKNDSFCRLK